MLSNNESARHTRAPETLSRRRQRRVPGVGEPGYIVFEICVFYSVYFMHSALTLASPTASVSALILLGSWPPDLADLATHECSSSMRSCTAHRGGMLRSTLARVSCCRLNVAQLKLIKHDAEQHPAASQRAHTTKWALEWALLHHPERTL